MRSVTFAVLMTMALLANFSLTVLAEDIEFLGAGATFPYPFYSKIFDAYYQEFGVKVNYQAIGSGGGIQQLLSKTVDFGGTDAFMSDEDLEKAAGEILHVPTCLGAVVITYHLPNNPKLNFTPEVIADIFLGKMAKWNDPKLQRVNPAVKLPNLNIVVVHRSDGSGTTHIFSDYLSKISSQWQECVGCGKSLNWPTGLGAKGNPGVAGLVQQLPGAIGYVELIYALQNDMPVGLVQNASGKYIEPSIITVTAAATIELPPDTRVSITNAEAEEGYPMSGFTWLLLYKEQSYDGRNQAKAKSLVELLWWLVHEGQQFAESLHYAPLPEEAVMRAEEILRSVTFDGKPVLK